MLNLAAEPTAILNVGQNIVDKYIKLSKVGFSMECFTADFLQFLSTTVKICLLGGRLDTCHQFQALQGFSSNFLISWEPKSWAVWQLVRQLVYSPFGDNDLVPFHFWWREIVPKGPQMFCSGLDFWQDIWNKVKKSSKIGED